MHSHARRYVDALAGFADIFLGIGRADADAGVGGSARARQQSVALSGGTAATAAASAAGSGGSNARHVDAARAYTGRTLRKKTAPAIAAAVAEAASRGPDAIIVARVVAMQAAAHRLAPVRPSPPPPGRNDVLRLLGPWLFEAAFNTVEAFAGGRAAALACLGRVLTSRGRRGPAFHAAHLARFYAIVEAALGSPDPLAAGAVMSSAARLFGAGLEGARMLAPAFVEAARRVLLGAGSPPSEARFGADALREGAVTVLASLVCVPCTMEAVPPIGVFARGGGVGAGGGGGASGGIGSTMWAAGAGGGSGAASGASTAVAAVSPDAAADTAAGALLGSVGCTMGVALTSLLHDALESPGAVPSLPALLWTACVQALDCVHSSPGTAVALLALIGRCVGREAWPPSAAATALAVASTLAGVADAVAAAAPEAPGALVCGLCDVAKRCVARARAPGAAADAASAADEAAAAALDTITDWCVRAAARVQRAQF